MRKTPNPLVDIKNGEIYQRCYFVKPASDGIRYRVAFYWSALKMTKYEEKLKYLNWSANGSSLKILSRRKKVSELVLL